MPADLLIAACEPDPRCCAHALEILDPTLRVVEPTAHLHVHATAAIPFASIWGALCEEFKSSGVRTSPFGISIGVWKAWLRRAVAATWVLEYWIRRGRAHLNDFLQRNPELKVAMRDLSKGNCSAVDPTLEASIEGFIRKCASVRRARSILACESSPRQRNGAANANIGEIQFVRRCLSHLNSSDDCLQFRTLFVQRMRIRVLLFRHLVHDAAQQGLDSFAERFDRIDEYRHARFEEEAASCVSNESGLILDTVELRGGPSRLSKLLTAMFKETPDVIRQRHLARRLVDERAAGHVNLARACIQVRPSISWILHFIRDRKGKDNSAQAVIRRHYETAEKVAATLQYMPELLRSVRALDVASRELSGPLWYLAGPMDRVLAKSRQVAARQPRLQGLQLTVHAGEHFRHLLGGLRAIHEPFWWGLMRRGDRIGHALAIGLDPKRWCAEHPVVVMPRSERMLDIAWMLTFVAARKLKGISAVAIAAAQDELSRHLRDWRVKDATVSDFVELAEKLGRREIWLQVNAPHWKPESFKGTPVLRLLWRLLRARDDISPSEMVEVRTESEADDLTIVRDELARLLARWRTPIEVNPSSNLLIGGFKYVLDQPLFHLDPFDPDDTRGLVLTLSADDPLCFATSLSDEFAYAWAGMTVAAGKSPAYAQEWLERAARNARRAAFRP